MLRAVSCLHCSRFRTVGFSGPGSNSACLSAVRSILDCLSIDPGSRLSAGEFTSHEEHELRSAVSSNPAFHWTLCAFHSMTAASR